MLKCTFSKGLNSINFSLLQKNNLKTFFGLISNKRNLINSNRNFYFFKQQFFSSQESKNANTNVNGDFENSETSSKKEDARIIIDTTASNQTDLVVKEKKKKKKILKSKTEEAKKNENSNEFLNTEKATNQTQKISNNQTKEKIKDQEDLDKINNKSIEYKLSKEEKSQMKKQAYRNKIKEEINLKDMYNIQSSKMGPVKVRKFFDFTKFKHPNVSVGIYDKTKFADDEKIKYESLVPISPKLGPYIVDENPKSENKTYHWCSCGLSKKQPFCDSSHSDTGFRPINFKLAEKCDSMMLCGCKLSKVAPFCDGATCIELKKIEEEGIKKQIKEIDHLPNTEKLSVKKPKKKIDQIINNNTKNEEIKEKAI